MIEALALATLAMAAGQLAPGPNLMAVASAGLAGGRVPALGVAAGVSTASMIWGTSVAFGLGTFLAAYPVSLLLLKFVGGGYLLWVGLRSLHAAWRSDTAELPANGRRGSFAGAWQFGVLVNMTNPKAALLWVAVATYLFGAGLAPLQVVLIGPLAAATSMAIYSGYAVLFSSGFAVRGYRRFGRLFETLFGMIFGGLGAKLVADGIREIRP
ncbi:MAG: LysE family translocator [Methyloligellaceae bacterium]